LYVGLSIASAHRAEAATQGNAAFNIGPEVIRRGFDLDPQKVDAAFEEDIDGILSLKSNHPSQQCAVSLIGHDGGW
jgi:hypothetical protein